MENRTHATLQVSRSPASASLRRIPFATRRVASRGEVLPRELFHSSRVSVPSPLLCDPPTIDSRTPWQMMWLASRGPNSECLTPMSKNKRRNLCFKIQDDIVKWCFIYGCQRSLAFETSTIEDHRGIGLNNTPKHPEKNNTHTHKPRKHPTRTLQGVSNGLPHTTYRLPLGIPWRVLVYYLHDSFSPSPVQLPTPPSLHPPSFRTPGPHRATGPPPPLAPPRPSGDFSPLFPPGEVLQLALQVPPQGHGVLQRMKLQASVERWHRVTEAERNGWNPVWFAKVCIGRSLFGGFRVFLFLKVGLSSGVVQEWGRDTSGVEGKTEL